MGGTVGQAYPSGATSTGQIAGMAIRGYREQEVEDNARIFALAGTIANHLDAKGMDGEEEIRILPKTLEELSALRASHAELVEALTLYVNSTDPIERRTAYKNGASVISRAQSLTSQQKPCSGHPDANAGAI